MKYAKMMMWLGSKRTFTRPTSYGHTPDVRYESVCAQRAPRRFSIPSHTMASHEHAHQVETPAHHPQGTGYKYAIVAEGKGLT
eukprot:6188055-Pleurochrysis_carterae.AAC.5